MDVVDAGGKKVTIKVTVDGKISITEAILTSAGVTGFDAKNIASVVLVVDDAAVTTGTLTLTTAGLGYVPVISTNSTATLTDLGGATVSAMEPCTVTTNPCPAGNIVDTSSSFSQIGTTGFSLGYDLANGTGNSRWVGGTITFANAFDASAKVLVLTVFDAGSSYY